jgi:hypothetical protein
MDSTLLTALLVLTAAVVVIQMAILAALYAAVKKTAARVDLLAGEMQQRVLPTLDAAQAMLVESRPKVDAILDNLNATTSAVRVEVEKVGITLETVLDRTRLQALRADELVTRTLDRVEHTTDIVHHTVTTPVRRVAGVVQGLSAGLGSLFSRVRRRRNGAGVPNDDMFI